LLPAVTANTLVLSRYGLFLHSNSLAQIPVAPLFYRILKVFS